MTIAIGGVLGLLSGVWLASLYYHQFFSPESWAAVAVAITGIAIVAGTVVLGLCVGEWADDHL